MAATGAAAVAQWFGASAATAATVGTTAAEVATVVAGVSAVSAMSKGPRINIPPSPLTPQSSVDQAAANAAQESDARRKASTGLQGTTGTEGGQAGAILSPSTAGQKSLLGG